MLQFIIFKLDFVKFLKISMEINKFLYKFCL